MHRRQIFRIQYGTLGPQIYIGTKRIQSNPGSPFLLQRVNTPRLHRTVGVTNTINSCRPCEAFRSV